MWRQATFGLVVVVVLLLCLVVPGCLSGQLWSTWSPQTSGPFTIASLDPNTATKGPDVYSHVGYTEFFAITPAIDYATKRMYLPTLTISPQGGSPFGADLVGFDMSNPSDVNVFLNTPLPGAYVFASQHDPANNRVWVVTAPLQGGEGAGVLTSLGYVDLAKGSYVNVTAFPTNRVPFAGGLGGSPCVVDLKGNRLLFATIDPTNHQQAYFTSYDIANNRFSSNILNNYRISAMAVNPKTNNIYALATLTKTQFQNVSFGIIDPSNGDLKILDTSKDLSLVFVVGSLATVDGDDNVFYTIMGNGMGPPVSVVTIDLATGKETHVARFTKAQPQSIFYL